MKKDSSGTGAGAEELHSWNPRAPELYHFCDGCAAR